MLNDRTIREINTQIQREMRTVGSFIASAEDKNAALDRITKLKALLTPQPSREEILAEVASALVEAQRNHVPTPADNLADALAGLFRR